jgi:hypothetical protein
MKYSTIQNRCNITTTNSNQTHFIGPFLPYPYHTITISRHAIRDVPHPKNRPKIDLFLYERTHFTSNKRGNN